MLKICVVFMKRHLGQELWWWWWWWCVSTTTIKISDNIFLLRYTSEEVWHSNPGQDINHAENFRGFHEASSRT